MGFLIILTKPKTVLYRLISTPTMMIFEIKVDYQAIADFNDKYLLIVDPMLATGQSISSFNQLMERGTLSNLW
jgi:uracil phosphoribosyltransferase